MGMDLVRKKRERGVILGGRFHGHVFFFQAEDGIRDKLVTGVQTCALPIFPSSCRCLSFSTFTSVKVPVTFNEATENPASSTAFFNSSKSALLFSLKAIEYSCF